MKHTIIKSSILGTNCWKPVRFCGGECKKTETCKFPEKNTCKAYINKVKVIHIPYIVYADGTEQRRKIMKNLSIAKNEKNLLEIWEDEVNKELTGLSFEEWKKVVKPNIGNYNFGE